MRPNNNNTRHCEPSGKIIGAEARPAFISEVTGVDLGEASCTLPRYGVRGGLAEKFCEYDVQIYRLWRFFTTTKSFISVGLSGDLPQNVSPAVMCKSTGCHRGKYGGLLLLRSCIMQMPICDNIILNQGLQDFCTQYSIHWRAFLKHHGLNWHATQYTIHGTDALAFTSIWSEFGLNHPLLT